MNAKMLNIRYIIYSVSKGILVAINREDKPSPSWSRDKEVKESGWDVCDTFHIKEAENIIKTLHITASGQPIQVIPNLSFFGISRKALMNQLPLLTEDL